MKPVAPDRLEIFEPIDKAPDGGQVLAVLRIVDRIRLGNSQDAAVLDIGRPGQVDALDFSLPALDELTVWRSPQRIAFGAEILETKTRLGRVRHHVRAPVLEVLNSSDLDPRVVDVD